MLPDKTKANKRKSSIVKRSCNPVYNEEFRYLINKQDLVLRTLQIAVWHKQTMKVNLFLGEVLLPLVSYEFSVNPHFYPLNERVSQFYQFK